MTALFSVGALTARSAGCIINDFTDRDIDKHVDRTKARPLTTGELSPAQAGLFLSGLMACSFGVLFSLPAECIKLGIMITPMVFIYPTTKRYFACPQLVLGTCMNVGVMIGFAACAQAAAVNWAVTLPFYAGGILWTVVYDTIYAFQDREFDKRLGLNSSAILMENNPHKILGGLAALSTGCFALGGLNAGLGSLYFLGLGGVASHYAWQLKTLNIEDRDTCWNLFQSNRWLGLGLVFAIMAGKWQTSGKDKQK
jgi:4-hydroxybenzoate polyprenyltransferase